MLNKTTLIFLSVTTFFILILLYVVVLHFKWDKPVSYNDGVEVNLPVIHWDKYMELSKRWE